MRIPSFLKRIRWKTVFFSAFLGILTVLTLYNTLSITATQEYVILNQRIISGLLVDVDLLYKIVSAENPDKDIPRRGNSMAEHQQFRMPNNYIEN